MEQIKEKKLEVKNLSKSFFSKEKIFTAVDKVSFDIYDGEFLVLLGPGRCGKTVLLNMLMGISEKTDGKVLYNGLETNGINPDFSMVFQKLSLLPFKTVMENVTLNLKFKGVSKDESNKIGQQYINLVGLNGFENSYPAQLSGGMKQRVGIARAYATNPKLLIMDEPFGQLDAQTRYSMQNELLKIREKEKRTILFVTNNLEEACYLGDRIILLSKEPATVKATYDVNIPRPRDMVSKEFMDLRLEISENTDLSI
jgi:ABC-type nitrate/sulfonate/bicarbonate transport system ATPase subunit